MQIEIGAILLGVDFTVFMKIKMEMSSGPDTPTYKNVLNRKICKDFFFLIFFLINLFIYFYFWLCWVFVSVRGLSLVAASGGHSSLRCVGLSLSRPLLLGAQAPDAQAQ